MVVRAETDVETFQMPLSLVLNSQSVLDTQLQGKIVLPLVAVILTNRGCNHQMKETLFCAPNKMHLFIVLEEFTILALYANA